MNLKIAVVALIISGSVVAPAQAAGCIKGALVGGLAAHVTHHNALLGALGGCLVGKVVAHYTGGLTFQDVAGRMLGNDTDLSKLAGKTNVNIVRISSLKGYKAGDVSVKSNGAMSQLDSEVANQPGLAAALQNAGYQPTDVVAVSAQGGGVIFVDA